MALRTLLVAIHFLASMFSSEARSSRSPFPGKSVFRVQRQNGHNVRRGRGRESRDQVDRAGRRQYVGIWGRPGKSPPCGDWTRTKNPDGFIDGGNGGLSTSTRPISSAAAPGKTATSRASTRVFATNSSTARYSTRYAKRKPSSRVGGVTTTVSGRTRPRCSCPGSPR
jgi:hypothetical protein